MYLSSEPSDEEMLAFVEAWIDDLARGDYEAAFTRTQHDPYFAWTPQLIRAVIEGYGLPEPCRDGAVFRVTDRREARGASPQRVVDREDMAPPALAEIRHDLPLNDEWSDLTATFLVERRDGGFVVVLQEIHVF